MSTIRPVGNRGTHLSEPIEYGRSVIGNCLEYWPSASGETDVLIISGIHGEEPDCTVILSKAMRMLDAMPERTAIVTCANPDGINRGTRGNANGVDLNRNFPTADWSSDSVTHRWTIDCGNEVQLSSGEVGGSEPEATALIELVENLKPKQLIALHGPLGWIDDPDDSKLAHWISEKTGLPVVADAGYPTPGSFGTWAAERGTPIITWEFPIEGIETMFHTTVPVLVELLSGAFTSPE